MVIECGFVYNHATQPVRWLSEYVSRSWAKRYFRRALSLRSSIQNVNHFHPRQIFAYLHSGCC